ncbi:hypothetical protein F183_A08570 [Bryobacterales bacterium F-183]|nr:hypothetical protein F183_A08570 [Bryobacterales bacterium F-183]
MDSLLFEASVRATVLGVAAGVLLTLFRVRSAEVRHLVWTIVLGVAIALPFVGLFGSSVRPAVLQVSLPEEVATRVAMVPVATVAESFAWLPLVYALVCGLLLLRVLVGLAMAWNLSRRAAVFAPGVRMSEELRAPVTFGSTVLLPASAERWSAETMAAVLRHEGEHCVRGDFYILLAAKIYRAVFWLNPLAWFLHARLAELAEQICDNAAVREDRDCAGYAELLVQFASKPQLATECGVAMARMSAVGRRVERLLDAAFEPAQRMGRGAKLRLVALALPLCVLCLAASVGWAAAAGAESDNSSMIAVVESKGYSAVAHSYDLDDVAKARQAQKKAGTTIVWYAKDGKEYMSSDPALIAQVRKAMAPQAELGKMQEKLTFGAKLPELNGELAKLTAKLKALQASEVAKVEDLARMQESLSEMQAKLAEAHSRIGETHEAFARQQAELAKKQEEMGRKAIADLEAMMERLAKDNKLKLVR